MATGTLVELSPDDIGRILELEEHCFIPPLRVTRDTLLQRFELGHHMLGLEDSGQLIGMASFAYGHLDPHDIRTLPKTNKEFRAPPWREDFDTVFLYNLEVDPRGRDGHSWKALVRGAADRAFHDGCTRGVGNVRPVSYAGGDPRYPQDRVAQNPAVRAAIDAHLAGGAFPEDDILRQDPLLGLYHRVPGCRFLWIVPNYAPDDLATGGIRVILYFDLPYAPF